MFGQIHREGFRSVADGLAPLDNPRFTGRVGIGTTTPLFALHAQDPASPIIARFTTSHASGALLNFNNPGTGTTVAPSIGAKGNSLVV